MSHEPIHGEPIAVGESPFARQQRGIPLAALFLLTAIVAVLLGMLAVALRTFDFWSDGWIERLVAGVIAAFVLASLGAVRGLFCFERAINVTIGAVAGATIGLLAAATLYASGEDWRELLIVASVGGLVIVALAAGIRWQASND